MAAPPVPCHDYRDGILRALDERVGDHHFGALLVQQEGRGATDYRAAAGDKTTFPSSAPAQSCRLSAITEIS